MAEPDPAALREAATHRGYRLLRSRKKTPGVGDFGKYGLTDAKGMPIMGIGDDGLTATGAEIEQYLRGGEAATWRQSADLPATPRRKAPTRAPKRPPEAAERPPSRREPAKRQIAPAPKPPARRKVKPAEPPPPPPPPQQLQIRMGRPDDMAAIGKMVAEIDGSGSRKAIADRTASFARGDSGFVVAEKGKLIGCLAWVLVPALHRPPSGRIATLIVTEKERRQGVGRALVDAAAADIARAGGVSIEAMSDIAIKSAHGFFRRTGFEETSYRFLRNLSSRKRPGRP